MRNSFSEKIVRLLRRSLTPNRPHHAQWLITHRCNYRCRGCRVWRTQKTIEEISADEVKAGLDILRELGVVEITFSGGNPLLRDDIKEIVDYASRYFITTVYDNGSMAVDKIDALRNADFVAISLDSLEREKNDYIKGVPGAYNQAVEAIKTLHEEGIYVEVSPTISQFNLHEIIDLTKYLIQRGLPVCYCLYWYDNPARNQLFGIGNKTSDFEITDEKTIVNVCDTLIDMKSQPGILITTEALSTLKHFFASGHRTWRCGALQSFLTIDNLGRIAGCHLQEPVTSLSELLDVWESTRLENLREIYSRCRRCAYLCYIFYSIHGTVKGNINVIHDQWRNTLFWLTGRAKRHAQIVHSAA